MALTTSRRSALRGRPPGLAAGSNGANIAHSRSLRSLGYARRAMGAPSFPPGSLHDPDPSQTPSSTTVTVTGSSGTEGSGRGVQDGADAIPESVLTPALI